MQLRRKLTINQKCVLLPLTLAITSQRHDDDDDAKERAGRWVAEAVVGGDLNQQVVGAGITATSWVGDPKSG